MSSADLVDPPAGRHIVQLAVDDALQQPHWRQRLKMPRSDLAALAVHCLLLKDAGALAAALDCSYGSNGSCYCHLQSPWPAVLVGADKTAACMGRPFV
jgi:hypothetical protein